LLDLEDHSALAVVGGIAVVLGGLEFGSVDGEAAIKCQARMARD